MRSIGLKTGLSALLSASMLIHTGVVYSAEPMSADAIRNLLTNNTMYCKNIHKGREFINYYREDGTVTKLLPDGEQWEGLWRVTEDGQHCQDWGTEDGECCFPIVDNGTGIYHKIDKGKPKTEFTVTRGNSRDL